MERIFAQNGNEKGEGAHAPNQENALGGVKFGIPSSLKVEHSEIMKLVNDTAKKYDGSGKALWAASRILYPHFAREEMLALPPLGLLRQLHSGFVLPEMENVLPMISKLEAEIPQMMVEQKKIRECLEEFIAAQTGEKRAESEEIAHKIGSHLKREEEVLYPTALLVGEFVSMSLKGCYRRKVQSNE